VILGRAVRVRSSRAPPALPFLPLLSALDKLGLVTLCAWLRGRLLRALQLSLICSHLTISLHLRQLVPRPAAQHEQAGVLSRVEGIRRAHPRPDTKSIRLIVVACSVAVARAESRATSGQWQRGHEPAYLSSWISSSSAAEASMRPRIARANRLAALEGCGSLRLAACS